MSVVAVVPAYREPLVGVTVRRTLPHVDRVVVVVEDFDQETGQVALDAGAEIRCSTGRSLASAIALGVAAATMHDDVVTLDGDGANPPDQIPSLLRSGGDVVVGSRFLPLSEFIAPRERRARSAIYSRACRVASGIPVRDWGGGLRLYRSGMARAIFPTATYGHAYQAEALWVAARFSCEIVEVPATYLPTHSTLSRGDVAEFGGLLARMVRERWR